MRERRLGNECASTTRSDAIRAATRAGQLSSSRGRWNTMAVDRARSINSPFMRCSRSHARCAFAILVPRPRAWTKVDTAACWESACCFRCVAHRARPAASAPNQSKAGKSGAWTAPFNPAKADASWERDTGRRKPAAGKLRPAAGLRPLCKGAPHPKKMPANSASLACWPVLPQCPNRSFARKMGLSLLA